MARREYKFEKDNLIILNVVIEGEGKVTIRMAIDTGATYSLVPWKIIQAIGLDSKEVEKHVFITTASTTEEVPLIDIPSVSILGKKIKNIKAVIHDLPPASRVDGLLGLNALSALKLEIDFSKNVIRA